MFARKPGKGITLEMYIRKTQVNKKKRKKKRSNNKPESELAFEKKKIKSNIAKKKKYIKKQNKKPQTEGVLFITLKMERMLLVKNKTNQPKQKQQQNPHCFRPKGTEWYGYSWQLLILLTSLR